MPKVIHTISKSVSLIVIMVLFAAIYNLYSIPIAHAESDSGSLTITAEKSLTVTVPGTTNLNIHPTENGAFNTADINIIVNSNNRYGYNLNMTTATTSLTGNAPLSSGNYPVIESISSSGMTCTVETGTTCNFTKDKWGYKLSTDTTYSPIQANTNMLIKNNTNESTGTPETSTVTFGARLSNATPAGSYSTTLTFIATINNPTAVGGVSFEEAFDFADKQKYNGYYAMQDIDATICSYVRTSEQADYNDTEEIQLIDKRDNKLYWVAKLLDNNCWMTQNLDFDITGPLDSTTTNLTTSGEAPYIAGYSQDTATNIITWTPGVSAYTITPIGNTFASWISTNDNPISGDAGNWYYRGGGNTYYDSQDCGDHGCDYLDGRNITSVTQFQQTPFSVNGQHGHVGNYYNWPAAVASSDASALTSKTTVKNSLCPANWSLSENTVYNTLFTLYGASSSDRTALAAPLYFVRAGVIWDKHIARAGMAGYYWTDVVVNKDNATMLGTSSLGIGTGDYTRHSAWSIRCLVSAE